MPRLRAAPMSSGSSAGSLKQEFARGRVHVEAAPPRRAPGSAAGLSAGGASSRRVPAASGGRVDVTPSLSIRLAAMDDATGPPPRCFAACSTLKDKLCCNKKNSAADASLRVSLLQKVLASRVQGAGVVRGHRPVPRPRAGKGHDGRGPRLLATPQVQGTKAVQGEEPPRRSGPRRRRRRWRSTRARARGGKCVRR
jgi:hypothetical protein